MAWNPEKNLSALQQVLGLSEPIREATTGVLDDNFPSGDDPAGGPVTLAVTDTRVIAFKKKAFGNYLESQPLDSVIKIGAEPLELPGGFEFEAILITFQDGSKWACMSMSRRAEDRDAFVAAVIERTDETRAVH